MTAPAAAPDQVRHQAASAGGDRRALWAGNGGLTWVIAVGSLAFFATAQYCQRLYVDTYFDLYSGRYVAEHGIPARNVVTTLAHGKPWIDQQWLAQLVFFRVWQLGGYAAVTLLSIALVSAGAAVLGALMLRRAASRSSRYRSSSCGRTCTGRFCWVPASSDCTPRCVAGEPCAVGMGED